MRLDYPNARGTLSAPLSKSARTVQFNADLEALLVNLLEGDWTYLLVRNDFGGSEVIKLAVELGQRVVYRAQDYTCATAFQQGDTVEYVFTTEHALVELPKFQLHVTGAATLEEYTVGYKLPSFEHIGSAEVVASGDDIILGRNSQAYGCCGIGGNTALVIEEMYIYLTSKYYPIAEIEKGFHSISKVTTISLWHAFIDQFVGGSFVPYILLYGSLETFTQYPEDAFVGAVNIYTATMYGSAIAHTQFVEDALVGLSLVFELTLYGNAIYHDQPATSAFEGRSAISEGMLT